VQPVHPACNCVRYTANGMPCRVMGIRNPGDDVVPEENAPHVPSLRWFCRKLDSLVLVAHPLS
jgi:hypothetical protein